MKFAIKDAFHRHKLDRRYLELMRSKMAECPVCGRKDGLNYTIDANCNIDITCRYKIKCENCGFIQSEWSDSIADAVLIYDMKARNK